MKSAVALAAAATITLLMGVGARADGNFSNLLQHGGGNSALVDQSPGNGNLAGAETLAARQLGNLNILDFTQSGSNNEIGTGGDGFLQQSDRNTATIRQSSSGNAVLEIVQTGIASGFGAHRRNTLSIVQEGGDGNLVGRVVQTRAGGLAGLPGQPGNVASILQNGAQNTVTLLSQTGLRNNAALSFAGSRNTASAVQDGVGNAATLDVVGDDNHLALRQEGGGNRAAVTVHGHGNNAADHFVPGARGSAHVGLADGAGLAPGDIAQTGLFNSIDYDLGLGSSGLLSDNNSFAFLQDGISNRIEGKTDGSGNQVVIVQNGALNFVSFVQTGNLNVIGVSQQ